MVKSELILPLRIYSDLYDQTRFNNRCDSDCEQQYITSSVELPNFQFTRESSLKTCRQFILRPVCVDKEYDFYKLVPEGADIFSDTPETDSFWDGFPKTELMTFDDGINPPTGSTANVVIMDECGGIKNGNLFNFQNIEAGRVSPALEIPTVQLWTPKLKYHFKIVVDKLILTVGSPFEIRIYNGTEGVGDLLQSITSAGTYDIEFTAYYQKISIVFYELQNLDEFHISYANATLLNPTDFIIDANDYTLSTSDIKVKQLANGNDIITYCSSSSRQVDPGDYYFIINMGGDVYWSEVFTVKDGVDLEKYYRLTWRNENDINDALIYNSTTLGGCTFKHVLYLDANLFNAKYETGDDVEKNGRGDDNSVFKRWQKTITLDVIKSPQFLTDALTAIFLYESVLLRLPTNTYQDRADNEFEIVKIESEVNDILNNCYQSVKLKLFLPQAYTDTTCANEVDLFVCPPSPPTITFDSVSILSGVIFLIEGASGVPGSFALVQYNLNGAGFVDSEDFAIVANDGTYSVVFDATNIGVITDLDVRVKNKTLTCTFATTAAQDVV